MVQQGINRTWKEPPAGGATGYEQDLERTTSGTRAKLPNMSYEHTACTVASKEQCQHTGYTQERGPKADRGAGNIWDGRGKGHKLGQGICRPLGKKKKRLINYMG